MSTASSGGTLSGLLPGGGSSSSRWLPTPRPGFFRGWSLGSWLLISPGLHCYSEGGGHTYGWPSLTGATNTRNLHGRCPTPAPIPPRSPSETQPHCLQSSSWLGVGEETLPVWLPSSGPWDGTCLSPTSSGCLAELYPISTSAVSLGASVPWSSLVDPSRPQ